jgi:hypothetical protein
MSEPLEWLPSAWHWMRDNWPWLAGAIGAAVAFGAWLHKRLLGDFVTNAKMESCKIEIVDKIGASEQRTEDRQRISDQSNADQHQDILSTVTHAIAELTSAVIGRHPK